MNVKLITNKSGDWEILSVDGVVFYKGHSIPNHIWLDLLKNMGNEIQTEEISDEDMETGDYKI